MGSSMTSMPVPVPQAARASSASPGAAIMRTGSKPAMARATAAYSCLAASKAGPQRAGRVGQAIRQASCSAHSAGMRGFMGRLLDAIGAGRHPAQGD